MTSLHPTLHQSSDEIFVTRNSSLGSDTTAMALPASILEQTLARLQRMGASPCDASHLGRAVLGALEDAGVDLKNGPSLEEMKCLLADVVRAASRQSGHTAA